MKWHAVLLVLLLVTPLLHAADDKKEHKVVEIKIREIDPRAAANVSYARQIRPILQQCFDCHSTEEKKSDFDTTSVAALQKKGKKAGPGVIPGKPDESAVVQYIRGIKTPQMPKGEDALSETELHLIRSWIFAGAADDSASVKDDSAAKKDSGGDPALLALLALPNAEEAMVKRRALRLAHLHTPDVPEVAAPGFNEIDRFIAQKWIEKKLDAAQTPPALCDDATFLRRVYLDLIGVAPTIAESEKFLNETAPEKRTKLIDELLARNNDYAAHWTPFWEDALGSQEAALQGGIPSRGNFREWILKNFSANKAYDIMVAELLDPGMPGYQKSKSATANGKVLSVGYIRNDTHVDTIQSAANAAQVFLGTSMKCASCHNHFLNKEWPQARFLAFAGMFAKTNLESIRCEKHSEQFVPAQFPFEISGYPGEIPADVNGRLHRVSMMITDPADPRFARAFVNRLWKRYIGLGLFEPADDFRLDQPPSHPELLDWLAQDFMRHDFDIKHTIRLILNSRTYQQRYDPALEDHFDVAKPADPRYFRSPALRRLSAEQLIDSIRAAATQTLDPAKRTFRQKASTMLTRALGKPASRNEISTARPDDVAVVQALELLNGGEFNRLVYGAKILDEFKTQKDRETAVAHVYLAALTRRPTKQESDLALSFLSGTIPPKENAAVNAAGDFFWALLCSPEFQYIK